MHLDLVGVIPLRHGDHTPVRAASAVAGLGDGWLVLQDDSTHAAWWRSVPGAGPGSVERVRIFAPVHGHDVFDEAAGTKHLKPDVEAACEVAVDGQQGVLMLGSGSSPARMRGALVTLEDGAPVVSVADLAPVYDDVAAALGVRAEDLNLEGACVLGPVLRWFHRGLPSAGLPTGSIDLCLAQLLDVVRGGEGGGVDLSGPRSYDLGHVAGVGLAVTDAVSLVDGSVLVSAAAEDTPNPRDDGPVVGSALVVLGEDGPTASAALPLVDARVCKVEGLALVGQSGSITEVLATVDADDPETPSLVLQLHARW